MLERIVPPCRSCSEPLTALTHLLPVDFGGATSLLRIAPIRGLGAPAARDTASIPNRGERSSASAAFPTDGSSPTQRPGHQCADEGPGQVAVEPRALPHL